MKVTQNDTTGLFVRTWMITVTVQDGEDVAMRYCRMWDVVPDAETVGKIAGDMFEAICTHDIEGIVFWKDGAPQCKIKRTDFGFEWPIKSKEE